ncbi:Photosystem II 11 kD protein [Musa troglodytarum]|uniref:Photosystem II 11 kD protein n=1 Tax=Musa troglodytarum TaxID=320322 RepID=A0A9E7FS46_9LILI|nr:Photosystem II 11 kD protein [Musa troglodytarum]
MIGKLRITIGMDKKDANVAAVAELREASNSWVANYRREKVMLGRASFRDVLRSQCRLRPLHQLRPHVAHPRQAQDPHLGRGGRRREGSYPGERCCVRRRQLLVCGGPRRLLLHTTGLSRAAVCLGRRPCRVQRLRWQQRGVHRLLLWATADATALLRATAYDGPTGVRS